MQFESEFLALVERLGLSLGRAEDGWKLAAALFLAFPRPGNTRGVQPDPDDTVDDIVLCYGVHAAKAKGPWPVKGGLRTVIRNIAEANSWPTDEISIETKRRRYYQLQKDGTPERLRMAQLACDLIPTVQAHLERKMSVRN